MYQFDWSVAEVGYSLAFSGLLMILVQVFLVRRVIPRLGEYRSALVGLTFCVMGHYTYAFGRLGWIMYVGMLLGSLSGLVGPSLNAIMSKQVGPRAQGELQGALGSLMSLTGVVGPLLMTQLFGYFSNPEAIVHFAGAPFFASASLMLISLVLLVRQSGRQVPAPLHDPTVEKVL
jgi:DHA1 family tetracycline resistance protein-like MFS transporter